MSTWVGVLLAGSASGVASTVVCHPLDVVRTRLQTSPPGTYRSATHCFRQITAQEGPLALYRGLSAPIAAQAVYKAVIFAANNFAAANFPKLTPKGQGFPDVFVSACFAGGVNSFVVTPVELVRNRLIVRTGGMSSAGPLTVISEVVKSDGVRGLWRGLLPTLLRDVPGVGLWLTSFEAAKSGIRQLKSKPGEPAPGLGFAELFLAGAVGGVGFWAVALPIDTIKSVVQVQETKRGLVQTVQSLVRERGVGYLFRAWPVAFGRGIPGAAVTLSVNEVCRSYLSERGL